MKYLAEIINRVFQNLLVVYLIMLLVNEFKLVFYPNVTNVMLLIVVVLGILTALFHKDKLEKMKPTTVDYMFVYSLGIIGAILVYMKTQELEWLSYLISLISGVLIILLGILVYEEDDVSFEFNFGKRFYMIILGILFGVALVLSVFIGLDAFRIVFGSVYVLFLPGFVWTYVMFKKLDSLERLALSFALSIAIVPLFVFYLNLLGMKINATNVALVISLIILVAMGLLYAKRNRK